MLYSISTILGELANTVYRDRQLSIDHEGKLNGVAAKVQQHTTSCSSVSKAINLHQVASTKVDRDMTNSADGACLQLFPQLLVDREEPRPQSLEMSFDLPTIR